MNHSADNLISDEALKEKIFFMKSILNEKQYQKAVTVAWLKLTCYFFKVPYSEMMEQVRECSRVYDVADGRIGRTMQKAKSTPVIAY